MNPTVERIQALFAENNPEHYYWSNLETFFRGHSHKAINALFSSSQWTSDQFKALLVLREGISFSQWSAMDPAEQRHALLTKIDVRRLSQSEGLADDVPTLFHIVKTAWAESSSYSKFMAWNAWSVHTMGMYYEAFDTFRDQCMDAWKSETPDDSGWKIQALVVTFDDWVERWNKGYALPNACVEQYSARILQEIDGVKGHWKVSPASIQTWRQLQGYTDARRRLGHPHPWLESLCVAYSGVLGPSLPKSVSFCSKYGALAVSESERIPHRNPSNPKDLLLAQALQRHFLHEPATPDPSVAEMYFFLEDAPNMVSVLLTMTSLDSTDCITVDTNVFEEGP